PLGRRKYWPIYAAAEAANLPIGMHTGGYGGHGPPGSGRAPFYNGEHKSNAPTNCPMSAKPATLGAPARLPQQKIVFIEGGFGFVPAITWRMDQHFDCFRSEVQHLKRKPSEYVRSNFWFTTQPSEEPDNAKHLRTLIEWIGFDRLLFSSDYPHWDFDDPRYAFKTPLSEAERKLLFESNARAVYKFD